MEFWKKENISSNLVLHMLPIILGIILRFQKPSPIGVHLLRRCKLTLLSDIRTQDQLILKLAELGYKRAEDHIEEDAKNLDTMNAGALNSEPREPENCKAERF